MKKTKLLTFFIAAVAFVFVGCGEQAPAPEDVAIAPVDTTAAAVTPVELGEDAHFASLFTQWFYQEAPWRTPTNRTPANDFVGGFVEESWGRPSYEELELMMQTASLASSARGRTPWYMVVVTDTETQRSLSQYDVEGEQRKGSDGTATVLIFSEWLLDDDERTDTVKDFFPREGFINAGILAGYLDIAANLMGYSTRMFMTSSTAAPPLGQRWTELEHFLGDHDYVWGSTGEVHSTENMVFVISVVIGTADPTVEAGATVALRPQNWTMWDPERWDPTTPFPHVGEVIIQALTLTDGVFTGTAPAYMDDITVQVTVENGEITEIIILEHQETQQFIDLAEASVVAQILNLQHIIGVDTVSGATEASEGIINAVANALGLR